MNWTEQPATESQLSHLRQFGYEPDSPLTKGQAAHLITDFEAHVQVQATRGLHPAREIPKHEGYQFRLAVEAARRALAEAPPEQAESARRKLAVAVEMRQEFWLDTCREPECRQAPSAEGLYLYERYGCRYVLPLPEQAQEILVALDSAMLLWDRDYPQLFYQTLELNFPDLKRLL
jgi:hypothetical protein